MVTMSNMTSKLLSGVNKGSPVLRTDPVTKVLYKQFEMVCESSNVIAKYMYINQHTIM